MLAIGSSCAPFGHDSQVVKNTFIISCQDVSSKRHSTYVYWQVTALRAKTCQLFRQPWDL